MKSILLVAVVIGMFLHSGCHEQIADPADISPLKPYQKLKSGTPVVLVLRVDVSTIGVELNSPEILIEQEGTLAWIAEDTVSIISQKDGQLKRGNYAGRMIREIRAKQEIDETSAYPAFVP